MIKKSKSRLKPSQAKKTRAKKTRAKKTRAKKTRAKKTRAKKTRAKKTQAKKTQAKKKQAKKKQAKKKQAKKKLKLKATSKSSKKKAIKRPVKKKVRGKKKKVTKKKVTRSSKRKSTKRSPTKKASGKRKATAGRSKSKSSRKEPSLAAQLLYGDSAQPQQPSVSPRTKVVERMLQPEEIRAEFRDRKTELELEYKAAKKALTQLRRLIKTGAFGEVNGCTVALRVKNGIVVSPLRYVLNVHVPNKISEDDLQPFKQPSMGVKKRPAKKRPATKRTAKKRVQCLPKDIDKVHVKVVESRPTLTSCETGFRLMQSAVPNPGTVKIQGEELLKDIIDDPSIDLKTTELIGGLPIVETDKSNWGTLGIAFSNRIEETSSTAKFFGIANAHFAPKNKPIAQPPHKPSVIDLWTVGKVKRAKEGRHQDYHVDAALIELNKNRTVIANRIYKFADEEFLFAKSPLSHFSERIDLERKVFKYGARTMQRLEGTISNPEFTGLRVPGHSGELRTVIEAKSSGDKTFILAGDSGSALIAPIFDLKTNQERLLVVGLCFAGSDSNHRILYACHFSHVLDALDLDIRAHFLRTDWRYEPT